MESKHILQVFCKDGEYRIIENTKNSIKKEKGKVTQITIDYIANSIIAYYDVNK